MSRTDRLMRLMDALRRLPAPVTAARLADETGVSPRQLYRDIATLRAGGALIDGEAGLGYSLTEDPALPPQSFSRLEIEALLLAVSGLRALADDALARAGEDALARIIATLPESQGRHAMHATMRLFRPAATRPAPSVDMDLLRQSLWEERSLLIDYLDLNDQPSQREIWPLGLSYSDNSMMLLAHCRLREDFRVFHVPRITRMERGPTSFRPRRVALLRDYVGSRATRPPAG
ncbi:MULTISPECIES: YafY family protein [Paracoccus]|jgi:predicted DNA-binding transcriptional regulator YafY|uniref:WYL domain-containing protein n=1 Tax=Paracoccus litorisediminis TaxID=2006130 RepID=A0A844HJI0_9RHOB|nr:MULTISPECIES: WYL domain-containing protein [Paracoccus]MBD9526066.1 WYL domain-containing protein [Paracoccus sp. PAR01]MTH58517.1 WYL domain-containing protein [Paracoccus litorisediminis]